MPASNEVKVVVEEFSRGQKQFTSIDVANQVKRSGKWRRNRDVASELRDMYATDDAALAGYSRCSIAVKGGSKTATLYFPSGTDPEDYKDRDQRADSPTPPASRGASTQAFQTAQRTVAAPAARSRSAASGILKRAPRNMVTQQTDVADIGDVLDTDIVMTKVIKTKERIKIPGPMIRKLGWAPGQPVDLSKIKTHNAVPVGIIVAKDYRVSLPRNALNWGTQPVKVILTSKNDIIFDQA